MSETEENKVGEKLAPFNPTCDEVLFYSVMSRQLKQHLKLQIYNKVMLSMILDVGMEEF